MNTNNRRRAAWVQLCAALIAVLTLGFQRAQAEDTAPVGKTLPTFSLTAVDNGNEKVAAFDNAAAKGNWVVLDFLLKTECPYCARRVGEYAGVKDKIVGANTKLVLIKPDDHEAANAWVAKIDVNSVVIYRDADAALAKALGVPGGYKFHGQEVQYPATLIVSPEGKVVWANVGSSNSKRAPVADVVKALEGLRGSAQGGTAMAGQQKNVLDFTLKNIDGKDAALSQYKGKVFLMVNVASKCGLTPQYTQLQALYGKYNAKGFEILGFPANNFGSQEPGSEAQIKEFCSTKYQVTFPMFSKISVKGADIAPLYDWLVNKQPNEKLRGEIKWNFNKFLVNKKGEVIARFEPKTAPDAPDVIAAIEKALAE